MPTNSLHDFIAHARRKGMDHQTIRTLLLAYGWKEKDVAHALTEEALDMPVPMPPDTGGAREAFFHLLTFASFFTTAISLIILFFSYINRLLPDAALQNDYYNTSGDLSGIRWSLAAVIVAFPLFLWLTRFLLKEMEANREKSWSPIRRWLTYVTLFVAAASIMGDVITLVFYLLEGEITLRFILKVFIILFIAGLSFAYYFLSLRMPVEEQKARNMHRVFGGLAAITVLVAIVWGIVLAGSPAAERERKFDERRVEDLRVIQSEVRNIALGKNIGRPAAELELERPLPADLKEVVENAEYQRPDIIDPESGEPYTYEVMDETHFRLCAVFSYQRNEEFDIFWNHPAGLHCYEFDVLEQVR